MQPWSVSRAYVLSAIQVGPALSSQEDDPDLLDGWPRCARDDCRASRCKNGRSGGGLSHVGAKIGWYSISVSIDAEHNRTTCLGRLQHVDSEAPMFPERRFWRPFRASLSPRELSGSAFQLPVTVCLEVQPHRGLSVQISERRCTEDSDSV